MSTICRLYGLYDYIVMSMLRACSPVQLQQLDRWCRWLQRSAGVARRLRPGFDGTVKHWRKGKCSERGFKQFPFIEFSCILVGAPCVMSGAVFFFPRDPALTVESCPLQTLPAPAGGQGQTVEPYASRKKWAMNKVHRELWKIKECQEQTWTNVFFPKNRIHKLSKMCGELFLWLSLAAVYETTCLVFGFQTSSNNFSKL